MADGPLSRTEPIPLSGGQYSLFCYQILLVEVVSGRSSRRSLNEVSFLFFIFCGVVVVFLVFSIILSRGVYVLCV